MEADTEAGPLRLISKHTYSVLCEDLTVAGAAEGDFVLIYLLSSRPQCDYPNDFLLTCLPL